MIRPQLLAAFGGLCVGLGVGYLAGMAAIENKVRKEYEESSKAFRNAMELSRVHALQAEAPAPEETTTVNTGYSLVKVNTADLEAVHGELTRQEEDETPIPNHYAKAIAATETPVEMFVEGGVNDYGISYIEEDDYLDESDDRYKGQITIVMHEHEPSFFMNGVEIGDWDERVGDSILVDFYKLVPPGINQVLYVRNHKRDEDYEVVREVP